MIVDGFTFFNELDMLELRLSQLYADVDRFVLVEAARTHSGQPKELFYRKHAQRFARFADKIVYVGLSELPPMMGDTEPARIRLESYQRNAIALGFMDLRLNDDDVVMVSDLDEIPSRPAIDFLKRNLEPDGIYTLVQKFYKFYLDEEIDDGYNRKNWGGTVGCRYRMLKALSPQGVRRGRGVGGQLADPESAAARGSKLLYQGGWHLSSFGGERAARIKVAHYIHGSGLNPGGTPVEAVAGPADALDPNSTQAAGLREALTGYITGPLGGDVPAALAADPLKYRHFFKSLRMAGV